MKLISLSQGKYAKIDDEDFERVNKYKWYYSKKHGAMIRREPRGISWMMHRFILNAPKHLEVDHKNGDNIDNRRENIRLCTHADNMRNRKVGKNVSGYKGVRNNHGKWQAYINFNNKFIYLGNFYDKKEAARKYNEAAKVYFGEFARLNTV